MVERLRADGIADAQRARRAAAGAAAPFRRRGAGHPGLRGHQPADRPRADHLQAVGRGAHDRAAAGRRDAQRRRRLGRVLEIGTGCGYQAARAGRAVAARCISIERLERCTTRRASNLAPLRLPNLRLRLWRRHARACAERALRQHHRRRRRRSVPQAWLDQLAVGGRLVAPVQRRRRSRRCWWWSTAPTTGFEASCARGGALRPPKIRHR